MSYPKDTTYRDYTIRQVDPASQANPFYGIPNKKGDMFLVETSYCKTKEEVIRLIDQYYDNATAGSPN
ncbi:MULTISPECIES: hypothetical protein [unclassified Pseudomonas]|uniref:hypothetical protein n=1 Tax=unclassified Pseudomonas TaxID=196821 RepID=UPI0012ECE1FE|nr:MULTISPECIES: hypothetical protein [unclassified Pseudomonas]